MLRNFDQNNIHVYKNISNENVLEFLDCFIEASLGKNVYVTTKYYQVIVFIDLSIV